MNRFIFSIFAVVVFFLSFTKTPKTIVIDAGHGAQDLGAVVNQVSEKDITLAVAQQIQKLNSNSDVKIILVRNDDSYPSLSNRVEMINKLNPDLVISLHANFNPKNKEVSGAEVYVQNAAISKSFGEKLAGKFNNCAVSQKNLIMLKNSLSPAVLLEMGYLSNAQDREYLQSENGQKETAQKILDFIYGIN